MVDKLNTAIKSLQFKQTNANNCIKFTIKLYKTITATCCGHFWPIIGEYNDSIKRLIEIIRTSGNSSA